jgi:hypothetical protein
MMVDGASAPMMYNLRMYTIEFIEMGGRGVVRLYRPPTLNAPRVCDIHESSIDRLRHVRKHVGFEFKCHSGYWWICEFFWWSVRMVALWHGEEVTCHGKYHMQGSKRRRQALLLRRGISLQR